MWDIINDCFNYVMALISQQQSAWAFLLSTAIVAAAGAYFGAAGAQRAINRDNRLRRRAEAIMAANAAHSLTVVIFNQAAALKKQHHLPALKLWLAQHEAAVKAIERKEQIITVQMHMQTPPPIQFPIKTLSELAYSKLTLNGRPLAALAELLQAEYAMASLANDHEKLRKEFEQNPDSAVERYLALETVAGQDTRFQDILIGMVDVLDDLIFYSNLLGEDLIAYADSVSKSVSKRLRKILPEVNTPGEILPGNEDLIPDRPHHRQWLQNHQVKEADPKRLRLRP